ncbi:tail fiber protein [Hymenobacter sp. BT175]|uniref:phage tail protein n=1 Tax=Hymenobacter translucens TaxID=2886507 RepID=UPI001D0E142D|nr:tail fiber protein [Hymenobacter translucens]MCC2546269.1 tail fiber protein [Hymenobacter translucens]
MDPYIGEIRLFAGNYAPDQWALCNGQLLQISEYDALYALLGTTYGGDGQTTFGLPDLRGRVAVGVGASASSGTRYVTGQLGGTEQVTLTNANLPVHTHTETQPTTLVVSAAPGTRNDPTNATFAKSNNLFYGSSLPVTKQATASDTVQAATVPTGGSQPHENRQPLLCINYIMALNGVWPSRP